MTGIADLPVWAAIIVCLLVLAGSLFSLIGAIGMVRLPEFYQRLHAPGLATSGAVILVCLGSGLCFALLEGRWIVHEVLIIIFTVLTTPITLMLLGKASLYRDRTEGNDVPAKTVPGPSIADAAANRLPELPTE
ncbi:multisubunit potassium/proton antiporter, PhaG subunit [Rhizobium sp. RU20A]|uniref:monovalent cation/H(+) antiporter subunit G n=1 Tax=Rhizobium sp. RU20A TaxID=1907412 RepID=UPI0009555E27|nr:monovalent cation/H(+) antiporter subunit G [Rhizobium sp. RU20A]SIQ99058.1 multisubunit potassium/proton antiporter, PhaG subunit [Rhizobium sp. RU20A]